MTEYRDAFRAYLRTGVPDEIRAMGVGTGSAGGYLFPEEFRDEFVAQLKAYAVLLADFTVVDTPNGRDLVVPGRQIMAAGSQVAENPTTAVADNNATFTGQTLKAFMFPSGVHKFPVGLVQDASVIPVESVVAAVAGEVIGRGLSVACMSGTGTSQPQGVYSAATAQGAWSAGGSGGFVALTAATAVEVDGAASTELAANVPSPKTLRAMVRAVDPAYHAGAAWYFNQAQFAALCGVTDNEGQPLVRANGPRVLWDFPVKIAPEITDLTASAVSGPVFGDLAKGMYYRDAGFELVRLNERFADMLNVAWIGYQRADTRVRDGRAFVTAKLAAT